MFRPVRSRALSAALGAAVLLVLAAGPARADHIPTNIGTPLGLPADAPLLEVGDWRFVANFPAGPGAELPLGVDWQPFTRDGKRYVVASSMTMGLTVFDVTDPNDPQRVSDYSSSFGCPHADAVFAADVVQNGDDPFRLGEAALGATSGWENDLALTPDGTIALIGTDAVGRCHDPKWGGVEIIDLSDVTQPKLLHLVRNTGMSHSISIDPYHPWLAYISTSDSEDTIEILDMSSCFAGDPDACRPGFTRYQFQPAWTKGKEAMGSNGCHDVRFRPTRVYCGAVNATLILDSSGLVSATSRTPKGTNLAAPAAPDGCTIEDADPITAAGIKVTDCRGWSNGTFRGAKNLKPAALSLIAAIHHAGTSTQTSPNEDVQISHQAEAIDGGRLMFVTDERGGGLNAGGSNGVFEGDMPACPGGGVWFYNITDERHPRLMKFPDGSPAVFITKNVVQTNANCTVHYGTQFENENVLVFAWYSQGTHVLRFEADYASNVLTLEEVATYIPTASSAWTSMGLVRNPEDANELMIFVTDIARGFDVLGVQLPRQTAAKPPAPKKQPNVLGKRSTRELAGTGAEDAAAIPLFLIAMSALVAFRLRRARRA